MNRMNPVEQLVAELERHRGIRAAAAASQRTLRVDSDRIHGLLVKQRGMLEDCLDVVVPGWDRPFTETTRDGRVPMSRLEGVAVAALRSTAPDASDTTMHRRTLEAVAHFALLLRERRAANTRELALEKVIEARDASLADLGQRLDQVRRAAGSAALALIAA